MLLTSSAAVIIDLYTITSKTSWPFSLNSILHNKGRTQERTFDFRDESMQISIYVRRIMQKSWVTPPAFAARAQQVLLTWGGHSQRK